MNKQHENLDVARRLKAVRCLEGLTQKPFSEAIGVSLPTYANYERGATAISFKLIVALSEKFRISADWLVTGRGDMIHKDRS